MAVRLLRQAITTAWGWTQLIGARADQFCPREGRGDQAHHPPVAALGAAIDRKNPSLVTLIVPSVWTWQGAGMAP